MQQPDIFSYVPPPHYPEEPGFKRTDTSKQAAESMKPSKMRLQQLVLEELARSPATSFELADRLRVSYSGIQPRTSELREEGKIIDSGERRLGPSGRNGIVWRIA